MLCACSGEQFKVEEAVPQSPESLATRDFSASGISSRTGTVGWDSKVEDAEVDEAESTLKEALTLNYEEARALLGRLEYQRGNYDGALQVFQGINIRLLSPRMAKAISERTQPRKSRSRGRNMLAGGMSLHSVSLLLEAILLKVNSLAEIGRVKEAARECNIILETVESALPDGTQTEIKDDSKLLETFHKALELLPKLWLKAGSLEEAISAYRRALLKPWNLEPQRLAKIQKDLATLLLYGGMENSMNESILLLSILMKKILYGEVAWDQEIMDHLTFALTICGQYESLADHLEQVLPGVCNRVERWYFLALCYSSARQSRTALNLLKKVLCFTSSEKNSTPYLAPFLLGAKTCCQDLPNEFREGIKFAHGVIDCALNQNWHAIARAHEFLGVCYGMAARNSVHDFERGDFHRESLISLNRAKFEMQDEDIYFRIGMENAFQRNLSLAFEEAMMYLKRCGGSSAKGWKLLALIASAEQRLKDAEDIVDLALDETGGMDQLELLRVKAVIQIVREQPKQAIETYRILLVLIQGLSGKHYENGNKVQAETRLELEAWLDLAGLYSNHKLWLDSDICIQKAKAANLYSPRCWHATGKLLEAQEQYKEAVVAFSISLSIEPDYVPSIVSFAQVLLKMDNHSSPLIAKSFLINALRLEPTNHDAWLSLGLIYKSEGNMQQAADSFQAAHELKLSSPVLSFQ